MIASILMIIHGCCIKGRQTTLPIVTWCLNLIQITAGDLRQSIYGFTKVSLLLKEVVHDIRGRLLLFFPGEYDNNNYRLLDARDNWNYLAVPITCQNGVDE